MKTEPLNKQLEQAAAIVAGLHKDETSCDLIVKSGSKTFNVHKNIVSASSEWFLAALTGGFKEAKSREITLMEDDEEDVARMIHFCYHAEYSSGTDEPPLMLHARMFALGEKYLMSSMQAYAVSKIRNAPLASFNITDFSAAVKECYNNTMDPQRLLKGAIVKKSVEYSGKLFGPEQKEASFQEMTDELPEYAADVLRKLHESCYDLTLPGRLPKYKCRGTNCTGMIDMNRGTIACDVCEEIWAT